MKLVTVVLFKKQLYIFPYWLCGGHEYAYLGEAKSHRMLYQRVLGRKIVHFYLAKIGFDNLFFKLDLRNNFGKIVEKEFILFQKKKTHKPEFVGNIFHFHLVIICRTLIGCKIAPNTNISLVLCSFSVSKLKVTDNITIVQNKQFQHLNKLQCRLLLESFFSKIFELTREKRVVRKYILYLSSTLNLSCTLNNLQHSLLAKKTLKDGCLMTNGHFVLQTLWSTTRKIHPCK